MCTINLTANRTILNGREVQEKPNRSDLGSELKHALFGNSNS